MSDDQDLVREMCNGNPAALRRIYEQIAMKVAREFFEALIAEDYAKAGQLYEGIPAARLKAGFGSMRFLRIVSIDQPVPHAVPATGGVVVPCYVEVENGGTASVEEFRPGIRPVHSQPDRWTIFGGI